MALGALDTMGRGALERWYRGVVAGLDDRDRLLVVAEEGDRLVGMVQLVFSGATGIATKNEDHDEAVRIGQQRAAQLIAEN